MARDRDREAEALEWIEAMIVEIGEARELRR